MKTTSDTSPAARRVLDACYARMSPADKLQRVRELTLAVNELAMGGLRARHGELEESELLRRLARLRLGPREYARAYGDPAADDGASGTA